MGKRLVLLPILALISSWSQATVYYDLKQEGVAASVDRVAMSEKSVDLLWRVAQRQQAGLTRGEVVGRLIENHLLGGYALSHYRLEDLYPGFNVAFPHDVEMENELVSTLRVAFRPELNKAVAAMPKGRLISVVQNHYAMSPMAYDEVFGDQKRLLLEYVLDAAHQEKAKQKVLLRYRFQGGEPGVITLYDVYARENVQGRMALFKRDSDYLGKQVMELLSIRFVLDWANRSSGLNRSDVEFITQAIKDRSQADALREYMGVVTEQHEGSRYLTALEKTVTEAEVLEYYKSHKDDFRRIEKVHAHHIVLKTEKDAESVREALGKGADFAELAKARSVAADREKGGDLGWIVHDDRDAPWLAQLAFLQKPGQVSRPVLSPGSPSEPAHWELIMVDERVDGYQAAESDSVRFAASAAIAKHKALENYSTLRQSLVADAEIHVAPSVVPENTLKF